MVLTEKLAPFLFTRTTFCIPAFRQFWVYKKQKIRENSIHHYPTSQDAHSHAWRNL